jgi:hypothetical protein
MLLEDKTHLHHESQYQNPQALNGGKFSEHHSPVDDGGAHFGGGDGGRGGRRRGGGAGQDPNESFETQADTVVTKVSTLSAAVMDPAVIRALRDAKALLDDGVLTEDEFKQQKRIILEGGADPYGIQQYGNQRPPSTRDGPFIAAYDEGPQLQHHQKRNYTPESRLSVQHPSRQAPTAESDEDHGPVKWRSNGNGARQAQWAPRVDKSGLVQLRTDQDAQIFRMKPIRPVSASTVMSNDDKGDSPVGDGGVQMLTVEALERHQAAEAARAAAVKPLVPHAVRDDPVRNSKESVNAHQGPGHAFPPAPRRGKGKMIADPEGIFKPGRETVPHVAAAAAAVDDTPLFMRDHNEEVERLRREAERELEAADQDPDPEYSDVAGLRGGIAQHSRGIPDKKQSSMQRDVHDDYGKEEVMMVTDAAIRDAWRQREAGILQTMADPVPSWQLPVGAGRRGGEVQSVKEILMQRQGGVIEAIDDGSSEYGGQTEYTVASRGGYESPSDVPSYNPRPAGAMLAFDGAHPHQPPVMPLPVEADRAAGMHQTRNADALKGMGRASGKRYVNISDDEPEEGWGSDVSSEGPQEVRVDPYDEDPFSHVFTSNAALTEAQVRGAALGDPPPTLQKDTAAAAAVESDRGGGGKGGGMAEDFEAEARRLEIEAAALKEAARIAEEQRKLREQAEQEAASAKLEVEQLRKQMEAMEDRMNASSKLHHRQKMAAVESIIDLVVGTAVDEVEAWWAKQAAQPEEDTEENVEEEEEEKIVMDDEGDGNDELTKWQKMRERDLKQNRKRRVTFNAAQEPELEARTSTGVVKAAETLQSEEESGKVVEEHARRLEAELRQAEEVAERIAGAGGRGAPHKPVVVQFVNPADISSSDDDEEAGEGNWQEEEEEDEDEDEGGDMWASLDPELLLKLQSLSAVLIQRAFRHYRARRASTPWASEVDTWPPSGSPVSMCFLSSPILRF